MKLPKKYRIEDVWTGKSDALQNEILDFWIGHGALSSRELATARLPQVINSVRTVKDGKLVAVCTVYPDINPQTTQQFFNFRCFVAPDHRRALLATFLIQSVYKQLNDRFISGKDPHVIGLLMDVQNEQLQEHHRTAVWTRTGMVFIGHTARGDQIRVNYFDGARIQ